MLTAGAFIRPCLAQAPPTSLWKDSWPQFSTTEAALTLSPGVGTLALAPVPPAQNPRWRGAILFDAGVRDALRVEDAEARRTYRS